MQLVKQEAEKTFAELSSKDMYLLTAETLHGAFLAGFRARFNRSYQQFNDSAAKQALIIAAVIGNSNWQSTVQDC